MTTDVFAMSVPGDACIMSAGCKNPAVMSFLQASFIADAVGMTYQVQQGNMLMAAESPAPQYVADAKLPTDRGPSRA